MRFNSAISMMFKRCQVDFSDYIRVRYSTRGLVLELKIQVKGLGFDYHCHE